MEITLNKWKIIAESENFLIIAKKRFKRITNKDFLELLEEMKKQEYKYNLVNYSWEGNILFERL